MVVPSLSPLLHIIEPVREIILARLAATLAIFLEETLLGIRKTDYTEKTKRIVFRTRRIKVHVRRDPVRIKES